MTRRADGFRFKTFLMRKRGGGVALGLHCLEDIAQGRELLARYDQRVL